MGKKALKDRMETRLVPFISAIERIVPIPMGQSILAVLRKQGSA